VYRGEERGGRGVGLYRCDERWWQASDSSWSGGGVQIDGKKRKEGGGISLDG